MIAKSIAKSVAGAVRMAVLALAVAAAWTPAHAQKPSANAIAMAREIAALKGSGVMYESLAPGLIDRVRIMNLQTNPTLGRPLEEVAAALRKEYSARVTAQLGEMLARTYAERFTEAELRAVLAFYKSAAGKKTIAEEPRVIEVFIGQLKDWQDKFAQEILVRFRTEMKKRGHEL